MEDMGTRPVTWAMVDSAVAPWYGIRSVRQVRHGGSLNAQAVQRKPSDIPWPWTASLHTMREFEIEGQNPSSRRLLAPAVVTALRLGAAYATGTTVLASR